MGPGHYRKRECKGRDQGNDFEVRVEADENLMDVIELKISSAGSIIRKD